MFADEAEIIPVFDCDAIQHLNGSLTSARISAGTYLLMRCLGA